MQFLFSTFVKFAVLEIGGKKKAFEIAALSARKEEKRAHATFRGPKGRTLDDDPVLHGSSHMESQSGLTSSTPRVRTHTLDPT